MTNVKHLKKLVMRKLKEGNGLFHKGSVSFSSLHKFRDNRWKTCFRSKGREFLLSSETSISELQDHSEVTLFIIQISCVLSFTENNCLRMLCLMPCVTRGKAVARSEATYRKRKLKKKNSLRVAWRGEIGRRGKVYWNVGNFQTPHRLPSGIGKKPQDFTVPKI